MKGVYDKMRKKIRYNIGDIFLVPLENNLYGAGRVLKNNRATVFIELYNVKPFKDKDEFIFENAVKKEPIAMGWCYDDGLIYGEWKIIDNRPVREDIEMPYFWHQDAGDLKYYIRKGSSDSYRTIGERIEISKEKIHQYEPAGIGTEISERNRYIERLREAGLV